MTTSARKPHPPRSARQRRSTVHYTVDIHRAEILEKQFEAFTAVQIRECLEGEPVKRAVSLLLWANRKRPADPYRALLLWARRHGRGFYSKELGAMYANKEYRRFMLYLSRKEDEKLKSGHGTLLPSEREALARTFYAPAYRARSLRASRSAATAASADGLAD